MVQYRLRLLAVVGLLIATGCGEDGSGTTQEVLVSAAASLTDAFAEIESAFEAANPDIDLIMNFGSSSALREQILEGAPIDVFAPADTTNMERVVTAGEVAGEPELFAHNVLQIAVPSGNPAGVVGLDAFGDEELLIGLCAEGVPCGDLARAVLARAGVTPVIDTDEPDVRALLTKIEVGELDAGITYLTDVVSAGGAVEGIDLTEDQNAVADYPIAVLTNTSNAAGAEAFVAFVLSDQGQEILGEYGFGSP